MRLKDLLDGYCGRPISIQVYYWRYAQIGMSGCYQKLFSYKGFKKPDASDWCAHIEKIKAEFGDYEVCHWNLCHGVKKNGKASKNMKKEILVIRLTEDKVCK